MDFVEGCAQSAGVSLADVEIDQRGMQHLTLIDHRRAVVYRFPRGPGQLREIATAAERLRVLSGSGLPAPRLLNMVGPRECSIPHLVLSYVPGVPLDTVPTDDLTPSRRRRLLADLVDVVTAIRSIPVGSWPAPGPAWSGLWSGLAEQVATCPGLPAAVRRHHAGLADAAAAVADAAPLRVFHGDLGGVNCRIDVATGAVTGLLDWDSAAVGDPATDIAALLAGLGPRTAAEMRDLSPLWRSDEQRYQVYLATWPIQYYLWSLRDAGPQEQQRAHALLSRSAAIAP